MPNARFSSKCEIHAFDRDDAAFGRKSVELGKQARVQFYHTSLGSATKEVPNGKRFREIGPDLKHGGKTIDVQRHVSYQNQLARPDSAHRSDVNITKLESRYLGNHPTY